MIAFNLTYLFLTILGVGLYKLIFPQKRFNFLILIVVFSLLPIISIFRTGVYESGDMVVNIYQLMSFYNSLDQGILVPKWAQELNATYGYPLFTFRYLLPFYTMSLFHFLGFSFINSFKIFVAVSYMLSGVGMYLFARRYFQKLPSFTAGIFYLYAPYHLVDMHFRVSIGELASFAIIPFVLLFTNKLVKEKTFSNYVCLSLLIALILLANQAIALFFFFLIVTYFLFEYLRTKKRNAQNLLMFFGSIISGLLLAAFYWVPAIYELRFTHQSKYVQEVGFIQSYDLLFSPWRSGFLFQGPKGELSFLIGYAQLAVIVICIVLLARKAIVKEKQITIFFLLFLLVVIVMMLPQSKFLWSHISMLRNFQFTYRLLLFVTLITGFIAGVVTQNVKTRFAIALILFAISQTLLNWGNRKMLPNINDSTLQKMLPLSTSRGEGFQPAVPLWVDPENPWSSTIPKNHLEIIEGKGRVSEITRSTDEHTYRVAADTSLHVIENTLYFPGWTLVVNGKNKPIAPSKDGVISFNLDKGKNNLTLKFEDTPARSMGKMISVVGLALLLSVLAFRPKI